MRRRFGLGGGVLGGVVEIERMRMVEWWVVGRSWSGTVRGLNPRMGE